MSLFFQKILGYVLVAEVLLFIMVYYFGPRGTHIIEQLEKQKIEVQEDIKNLEASVAELHKQIAYESTDFAKEKVAREKLLMKKDQEIVYFKK